MFDERFIKPVEEMSPSPLLDGLPVGALMHDTKVGPWFVKIGNPVKCQQRHVSVAHDVLSQTFKTVICPAPSAAENPSQFRFMLSKVLERL